MLTSIGQALDQGIEIIDDDPRMRLAGGPEVVLDAQMQLHATSAKLHTATRRENRWLVYLCHVKDIDEERASCGLLGTVALSDRLTGAGPSGGVEAGRQALGCLVCHGLERP